MPENNKVNRIQSSSIDARIHQTQKSGSDERYLRREARQVGTEELMEQQAERMTQSTRDLQKEFKPNQVGGYQGYNSVILDNAFFNNKSLPAGVYFFVFLENDELLAKGKFAVIP